MQRSAAVHAAPTAPKDLKIGLASAGDAEQLHALLNTYSLAQARGRSSLQNGWLRAAMPVAQLRYMLAHVVHCWVVRMAGKIVACAIASPPTRMPFLRWDHGFTDTAEAARALDVLKRGQFVYVGSAATHPDFKRMGFMSMLEERMARHYRGRTLLCHIGILTQQEVIDANWCFRNAKPSALNKASHEFFQRRGWKMVGFASTLGAHTPLGDHAARDDEDLGRVKRWGRPEANGSYLTGMYARFPEAEPTDAALQDPLEVLWRATIRPVSPDARVAGDIINGPAPWQNEWELPVAPHEVVHLEHPEGFRLSPHNTLDNDDQFSITDSEWERWYYLGSAPDGHDFGAAEKPRGFKDDCALWNRCSSFGWWFYRMWPEGTGRPPRNDAERHELVKAFIEHQNRVAARCPSFEISSAAACRP